MNLKAFSTSPKNLPQSSPTAGPLEPTESEARSDRKRSEGSGAFAEDCHLGWRAAHGGRRRWGRGRWFVGEWRTETEEGRGKFESFFVLLGSFSNEFCGLFGFCSVSLVAEETIFFEGIWGCLFFVVYCSVLFWEFLRRLRSSLFFGVPFDPREVCFVYPFEGFIALLSIGFGFVVDIVLLDHVDLMPVFLLTAAPHVFSSEAEEAAEWGSGAIWECWLVFVFFPLPRAPTFLRRYLWILLLVNNSFLEGIWSPRVCQNPL